MVGFWNLRQQLERVGRKKWLVVQGPLDGVPSGRHDNLKLRSLTPHGDGLLTGPDEYSSEVVCRAHAPFKDRNLGAIGEHPNKEFGPLN